MRVFFTTTIENTREILKSGFKDIHHFGDAEGVYVGNAPLDASDGFFGDVVLCLNVPDAVFNDLEEIEMPVGKPEYHTGRALIPAATLNAHGPAQVYDHFFAGASRPELLAAIQLWREAADHQREMAEQEAWKGDEAIEKALEMAVGDDRQASEMKAAYDWFDAIGWLTPLRVREEQST